jgi:hypothetical protein
LINQIPINRKKEIKKAVKTARGDADGQTEQIDSLLRAIARRAWRAGKRPANPENSKQEKARLLMPTFHIFAPPAP